jgi:hypothetical protein
MAHARKQIREAVAALIGTNGVTVEQSRQYPMLEELMPRYLVFTTSEDIDTGMTTANGIMRVLQVMIEAIIMADETTIDDDLDAHALYLEKQVNWTKLGGLALRTLLERSELSIRTEGDRSLGVLTLTFSVMYRTLPSDPEIIS